MTLEVQDIWKSFGGVEAIAGLSVRATKGSVHGVIGPNGAGKTTLLSLIAGATKPDRGVITWGGRSVTSTRLPSQLGIGRTFQEVSPLGKMTVLDNVLVGLHSRGSVGVLRSLLRTSRMRTEEQHLRRQAEELLAAVELSQRSDLPANELSFGELRLLEVVRMLAAEPTLVLLDEPAAGLNEIDGAKLLGLIRQMKEDGRCVLLVEHDMRIVFQACDMITVMNSGTCIASGTPEAIRSDAAVQEAYLSVGDGK